MSENEPKKSKDIPVTQEMLNETRSEVLSKITSLSLETKAGFERIESKLESFEAVKSDMKSLHSRMDSLVSEVQSGFSAMLAEIKKISSETHGIKADIEEVKSRNRYVLDGYDQLHRRQGQFEEAIDQRVSTVESIIKLGGRN